MKKRLLSTLLTLFMVLVLLQGTALAAEASGSCGDNLTWSYSNGTLSIQGEGRMKDYVVDGAFAIRPWNDYLSQMHTIRVGDGVTSIGAGAFYGCGSLTSVTMSDSVTSIGAHAFAQCSSLTSVTMSDNVTSIGDYTFFNCKNLTYVTIPNSVTYIGYALIGGCNSLTDIYYGGSESQLMQIVPGPLPDGVTIHYNSTGPVPATPSGLSVTVSGKAVAWTDAAPFIDTNSRTMVPLRAVADAMNLTVNWDGSARVASFSDGGKTISFPIDSNSARTSDGGTVQMDTAAVIKDNRTYAPIRYLAEYFGYEVGWDGATRTVSIK